MIKICSTPHTAFSAKVLKHQLTSLGYKAIIIDKPIQIDKSLHIFIGIHPNWRLPRNYIFWQTEVVESHYFTKRYLDIIKNSLQVWEYNKANLSAYSHKDVKLIEPSVLIQPSANKDIDFVFYGWIEGSKRRKLLLNELGKHLNVKIYTNVLKDQMWNILARTKVILNIHYYDSSPLELFRISECFSHGCHVVSEGSSTHWSDVSFANGIEDFIIKAKELKDKPFDYNLSKYDNTEKIKQSIQKLIR